jgi:hypothetical protein
MESFWEGFLVGVGVVIAAFVIVWGADHPRQSEGLQFKKRPKGLEGKR